MERLRAHLRMLLGKSVGPYQYCSDNRERIETTKAINAITTVNTLTLYLVERRRSWVFNKHYSRTNFRIVGTVATANSQY